MSSARPTTALDRLKQNGISITKISGPDPVRKYKSGPEVAGQRQSKLYGATQPKDPNVREIPQMFSENGTVGKPGKATGKRHDSSASASSHHSDEYGESVW